MDKDFAWQIVRVSFATTRNLQNLLPSLKEHTNDQEYGDWVRGIAGAIDAINDALLNKALAAHPELGGEIEAELDRSGRID
jgi:hypothetical protein